ncbi:MAG: DNA alkylation repair protein [Halocynthiibacter sp.]
MNLENALLELKTAGNPKKAEELARHHKVDRVYLGIANPVLDEMCRNWRQELTLDARVELASDLWNTDIHEARIAAAKLLTQARIAKDDAVWALIQSWVEDLDTAAIADQVCTAGQKRLLADPSRFDTVETWTQSDYPWIKRSALAMTKPWAKKNHLKAEDITLRDRVLAWAADFATDHTRLIQNAITDWLSDLSRHDAARVEAFLDAHGELLKPYALRDTLHHLKKAR